MKWIFKTALVFWFCAIGLSVYGNESMPPFQGEVRVPLNERERLAVAASISGTVVSRDLKTYRLEALPDKNDKDGCVPVSVKVVFPQWDDIYRYRVCSGLIFEESGLERDLEDVIQEIAKKARQYGLAQAAFQGFIVKGSSVSSDRQCNVEISVFKGKQLTEKRSLPCE